MLMCISAARHRWWMRCVPGSPSRASRRPISTTRSSRRAAQSPPSARPTEKRREAAMMTYAGRFAGKVAVVTGAAQGIGRTVALRLAREGGKVALVDRSALVEEVRHEAESAGTEALAITADLETFAGATDAMRQAQERFGRIDILVNNVGGTIWAKPFAEYEEA